MRLKSRARCAVGVGRWVAYAVAGAATSIGASNEADASHSLYYGSVNATLYGSNATIQIHTLVEVQHGPPFPNSLSFHGLPGTRVIGTLKHVGPVSHGYVTFQMNPAYHGQVAGIATNAGFFGYASRLGVGPGLSQRPFIPAGAYNTLAWDSYNGAGVQWNAKETGLYGGQHYLGFKYNLGSGVEYGWARLTNVTGAPNDEFILDDYSLNSSFVGAVPIPEPVSLGLLALGATGLLAARAARRRDTEQT